MIELIRLVVEVAILPTIAAVAVWAITRRKSDQVSVGKVLAETIKTTAEGEVAAETTAAAIELADVTTLQAHVTAMAAAFREERESLTRRLTDALTELRETRDRVEEVLADYDLMRREMLDMYRRDAYHARAVASLGEWMDTNLPKLRTLHPDLEDPPKLEPLPPLLTPRDDEEGSAHRRWYDVAGDRRVSPGEGREP